MSEEKKVAIYVRAPNDETRTLSFRRIPEIEDTEALEEGWAIDGNAFLVEVLLGTPEGGGSLLEQERRIVEVLEGHGYKVEFK